MIKRIIPVELRSTTGLTTDRRTKSALPAVGSLFELLDVGVVIATNPRLIHVMAGTSATKTSSLRINLSGTRYSVGERPYISANSLVVSLSLASSEGLRRLRRNL